MITFFKTKEKKENTKDDLLEPYAHTCTSRRGCGFYKIFNRQAQIASGMPF
jgi:hypothetical protein